MGSTAAVYDAAGHERFRVDVDGLLDVAPVGSELWAIAAGKLVRLSASDGRELSSEKLEYLDPGGRLLLSSTAPIPVWHADRPLAIRATPARTESPGPGGEVILPIADGRWLLWQAGQLRLWRTIGEAWRKPFGDPGTRALDAQLVLEGRLFVLAQQRDGSAEMRVSVAGVTDGAQHAVLRIPQVDQLAIAARRGLAVARTGDRLGVFDLRFGRWVRDLALPAGTTDIAVDDGLQTIALGTADGVVLVRADALASPVATPTESEAEPAGEPEAAKTNGHSVATVAIVEPPVPPPPPPVEVAPPIEPFPDAPLVRLDPVSVTPDATAGEVAQSIELQLQLVGARVYLAIAEAWDCGRIVKPDQTKPPFVDEVGGLLRIVSGRAVGELERARARLDATIDTVLAAQRERAGRRTPLDVLARDFDLTPLAVSILFVIAAPRLRGELARLYGILANDPGRALVDEFLLGQILGAEHGPAIARELDGDRPLRRFGLVRVAPGERPFAGLTADSIVVRYITNQPADGEPDQQLVVRHVDRDLDELQMPRALILKALRFLSTPRDDEPVRIVAAEDLEPVDARHEPADERAAQRRLERRGEPARVARHRREIDHAE